jgi:hypothetical protein
MMWTAWKTWAILAGCLLVGTDAAALELTEPFVALEVQTRNAHLGDARGPGLKQMRAQFWARVVANCPYHVEVSFQGLRHRRGRPIISPAHMAAAINGQRVRVGGGWTPVADSVEPTPSGGVGVPIDLHVQIRGLELYPPGRYVGMLAIRVTAGL